MGGPLDQAIGYLKFLGFLFSIVTILALIGIVYYLKQTGLYPQEAIYDHEHKQWVA